MLFIFIAVFGLYTCRDALDINEPIATAESSSSICRDMDEILTDGKLVALTDFSSSSYFIYRGVPMGFEYELLDRFAKHIGVDLEIEVVEDLDNVIPKLNDGQGDVIAANYTITQERQSKVMFTYPVLEARQVLVQRMPDRWWTMKSAKLEKSLIRNPAKLIGKTVHVRKESSFYPRLLNLMDEIGGIIHIEEAGNVSTEKLIEMVSNGDIDYTIADENVALLNKGYYPNLDILTPVSFPQRMAWAVRHSSPALQEAMNTWLEEFQNSTEFAIIYLKYFKARTQHKARVMSEYSSFKGNRLSPYDELIKSESERLGWDWKLLAAIIYQESKFVPDAESWMGASGLMQLIPETAERFGADSISDPKQNVHAGVSFMLTLQDYWAERIPDTTEQIKYVLASYNVGLGHVLDAMRLAEKNNANPKDWEDVAVYLELKSEPYYYKDAVVRHGYCRGKEPVTYVRMILGLWNHYKNTAL